jgi:flagellar motor switch protein FliN/FliY
MENEGINEGLEQVAGAAEEVSQSVTAITSKKSQTLDFLLDVTLQISVEVGRARMTIQDLLQLGQGSVMELEKLAGEPLDIYVNGRQVARGEAVIVNEKFGVRLTDIISPDERVEGLG